MVTILIHLFILKILQKQQKIYDDAMMMHEIKLTSNKIKRGLFLGCYMVALPSKNVGGLFI